jgi:spermidine synthase
MAQSSDEAPIKSETEEKVCDKMEITSTLYSPQKSSRLLLATSLVFVASGFCGLIYQSIWTHYLKLFLGHAAYAQTLVLIVFIGGMAVGAGLCGRYAKRVKNGLLYYAVAELIIGACSLAFHGTYVTVTNWAYDTLLPATCQGEGICASRWLLSAALILPQSLLLGATFPLMAQGALQLGFAKHQGRVISVLYFTNSIGAAAGVLVSGFALIPLVGLPGTLMTAGIMNVLLSIAAYALSKYVPGSSEPGESLQATPETSTAPPKDQGPIGGIGIMLTIAAVTGASSFIYEIVWIRSLSLVLGSATHSFELMLSSFILGIALGSYWIRNRIDSIAHPLKFLAWVQIWMGIAALLSWPTYMASFDAMSWLLSATARSEAGWWMYNIGSKVICVLLMIPTTFFAGMTLPLITNYLLRGKSGESAIGKVYSANTFGSIAGIIIAVHVLLPWIGLKSALVVGALIDIGLGVYIFARLGMNLRSPKLIATSIVCLSMTVMIVAAPSDKMRMLSGVFRSGNAKLDDSKTKVLYYRDGKSATVALTEASTTEGLVRAISTNGKVDGAIANDVSKPRGDEFTMTLTAVLPLMYFPEAKSAALVGFGTGMSTATLLGSPNLKIVETVEIEPAIIEGARGFGSITEAAFTDPRSRIVIDDARAYFSAGKRTYDLLISEPSNPWVSGVASLFTEEYFKRAKRHLSEDGVFAQWLQVYELNPEVVSSIFRAFEKTFPNFHLYATNSADLILVARNDASKLKPDIKSVLAMPDVAARLKLLEIDNEAEIAVRWLGSNKSLMPYLKTFPAPANSDFFPYVDNNAAKARFMRSDASVVTMLPLAPFPLRSYLDPAPVDIFSLSAERGNSFQARVPKREDLLGNARLQDFLEGNDALLRQVAGAMGMRVASAITLRSAFQACRNDRKFTMPWNDVNVVLSELSSSSGDAFSRRYWKELGQLDCIRESESSRIWASYVAATAVGDAATVWQTGRQILKSYAPDEEGSRQVIVMNVSAAGLAVGKLAEAREIWDQSKAWSAAARQLPSYRMLNEVFRSGRL